MQETNEVLIENKGFNIVIGLIAAIGLFLVSRHSYLLFHSLAEIFSIIIASGIFMFVWNSRKIQENDYLLFIGIAYLFVGGIDLLHTLSYKGMGVFIEHDANLPTQLWIIARYTEGLTLLIAPIFLKRKINSVFVFSSYAGIVLLLLLSVFSWEIFPACFIEGFGLTPFKKISEYIITFILLGAIIFLFQSRNEFDRKFFRLIVASIITTILAELAFTFYVSVYGLSNLVGHYFKIISFYLIYAAIIHTGLQKPYTILFRKLKQNEMQYISLFNRMLGGFAHHEIIYDDNGQPIDYRFLAVNPAFENLTGLKAENIVGKTVLEVLPGTEKYWIDTYGKVALTGEPIHFENYSSELNKHYFVSAYRTAENQFACVFRDMTEEKKSTKEREQLIAELQKTLEEIKTLQGIIPICAHCKQIRDDKGLWNQLEEYIHKHSDAEFSHGICPDCAKKHYPEFYDENKKLKSQKKEC